MSRARNALVEAVLAATVVGIVEGAQLAWSAGSATVAPLAAAAATLGALVLAVVVRVALAGLARLPLVRAWTGNLAAGGERRTVAAWRGTLAFVTLGIVGGASFMLLEQVHDRFRFNDAGPIALGSAGAILVLAIALVFGALAVDRRVRPRLPAELLDSRRAWRALGLAALLVVLVAPALIVGRAIPALTIDYAIAPSVLVAALLVAAVAHVGTQRAARYAALGIVVASFGGAWALTRSPSARGAIVERGIASAPVVAALRSLGDRDGDGYAGPSVGGADCDDGNPARHPGAIDVPDNGVDENCTGNDAVRATFGLRNATRPVPPVQVKPNIVLVSIDALRADHLGAYGYARPTSPTIDALAAAGVRFTAAYTPCPSTRCAVPALHTGRYASTLDLGPGGALDRGAIPTLARVLRDAGWATAAITCCDRFATARGEMLGFQTLDATADALRMRRAGQSNADVVVDRTLAWLRDRDRTKPYFAWLHLYEPHFPYAAPGGPDFGSSDVDRYDAEIAFADAQLARLVAELEPQTIIVVTSDHGEEFGEHGIRFHARSLYNGVVRVPLVMRVPGVAARTVSTSVSLVDVMPTLLDLAGVEGPTGMNGRTLVPALHGGAAKVRPILIELAHDRQIKRDMAGVVSAPYKVIWDREANAWSLYKLDDAAEATNLRDAAALAEMQRLLAETLDRETGAVP